MLAQRLRRWANIKTALAQCIVLAGKCIILDRYYCESSDNTGSRSATMSGPPPPLIPPASPLMITTANNMYQTDVVLMLGHCWRQWANIKPPQIQRLVSAGPDRQARPPGPVYHRYHRDSPPPATEGLSPPPRHMGLKEIMAAFTTVHGISRES